MPMTPTVEPFLRVQDGVVTVAPARFDEAIDMVAREKLHGVMVCDDFADRHPDPPRVNLSRLLTVPFIDDFGVSPGFNPKRLLEFEALYELSHLKKLGMHSYRAVDLSRFPKLEMLFLTDGPGCTGLESLSKLRYARIWKLESPDLSILAKLRCLDELWLIQTRHQRVQGLDKSAALSILTFSHNPKLASIAAIPRSLAKLRIEKCSKLSDLGFLDRHPNLEFLVVDVMANLGFVPGLPKLAYVAFQNVLDGDLSPLLKSASVTKASFHPAKRKHYSHTLPELTKLLAAKQR
jgi:hypothetical protein